MSGSIRMTCDPVSRRCPFPLFRQRPEGLLVLRPIVERGGIGIRAIGPDEGVHLWIERDLVEQRQIAQRTVQLAGQDGPKIYGLFCAVIELDAKCVWGNDLKSDHAVDWMAQHDPLLWRCYLFRNLLNEQLHVMLKLL